MSLASQYQYGGPTRSPVAPAVKTYAYGGPTRSPSAPLVNQYAYGGPTRSPTATTSGSGTIGNFFTNLGGAFQQITRTANNLTARATGTNTDNAPEDGARDWLARLPQISRGVMDIIGAGTPPEETVTVTEASYGSGGIGGIDLQTLLLIGAVGVGVYYVATR